jgi:MtN3 and saliva related transmembrane protein
MLFILVSFSKWIGITAGVLTATSLMPPLVKLIREKKPETVPIGMLAVLLVGLSLWIYYGILNKDWPLTVTNCFSFLQNVIMLVLQHKYKKNKPNNKIYAKE